MCSTKRAHMLTAKTSPDSSEEACQAEHLSAACCPQAGTQTWNNWCKVLGTYSIVGRVLALYERAELRITKVAPCGFMWTGISIPGASSNLVIWDAPAKMSVWLLWAGQTEVIWKIQTMWLIPPGADTQWSYIPACSLSSGVRLICALQPQWMSSESHPLGMKS